MIEVSTIQIAGIDALDFLQGQLTCDMRKIIDPQKNYSGALCNPQGRVIASLEISKLNNAPESIYHLNLPSELSEKVLKNLKKYALFADVAIDLLSSTRETLHLLESIQQKIAVVLAETSEKFTPHELNYHQLGWISFDKGCYKGQEIIARMHYLGKLKKQLTHICFKTIDEIKILSPQWPQNKINIALNTATEEHEALVLLPVGYQQQSA